MDGDFALINLTKPIIRGEFGQDLKEGYKEDLKVDTQASSSSSKPITPIMVLKPVSIEATPLLQHHNPIFDLQNNSSHKKFEAPNPIAKEGEHPNTKEPMNTQELLNTMVASPIELREDMNLIVQQFQNLKSNQEENKTDHDPPTMESEKKINERMNKMEEMIRKDGRPHGL